MPAGRTVTAGAAGMTRSPVATFSSVAAFPEGDKGDRDQAGRQVALGLPHAGLGDPTRTPTPDR